MFGREKRALAAAIAESPVNECRAPTLNECINGVTGLTAAVEQLEALAFRAESEALLHGVVAEREAELSKASADSAVRARKIAGNLRRLLAL